MWRPHAVIAMSVSAESGKKTDAANRVEIREKDVQFTTPGKTLKKIVATEDGQNAMAVYTDTFTPGIYQVEASVDGQQPVHDAFVVNYDHAEDDLTALTADDKARLATNDRVRFSASVNELTKRMYGEESVTELWATLMIAFLLFLVAELLLTRRTIRKGYGGESLAAA